MPSRLLTPKQQAFVREYLVDLNASAAARRAGYSERTARAQGCRLLTNADITDAIAEASSIRSERTEITQDYVVEGLREVAERCMERAPVMVGRGDERHQLVDAEGRHVWQFDSIGALRAFELLGKHLGMFRERVSHENPDGSPLAGALRVEVVLVDPKAGGE